MTRLVVHIDRLVLHGVAPSQRAAVAQALQEELQRQLADPATLQRWARMESQPRLQVPPIPAPKAAEAATLGIAMARHLAQEAG